MQIKVSLVIALIALCGAAYTYSHFGFFESAASISSSFHEMKPTAKLKSKPASKPVLNVEPMAKTVKRNPALQDQIEDNAHFNNQINRMYSLPPHLAYNDHIKAANRGVAKDQYILSIVLQRCPNLPKLGEPIWDRIEKMKPSEKIPEGILNEFKKIYSDCKELVGIMGDNDIGEIRSMWLHTAAIQGYSLAMLDELFRSSELDIRENKEVALKLVYSALENSKSGSFEELKAIIFVEIYNRAYSVANSLEEGYKADPYNFPLFNLEAQAWSIVSCQKNPDCKTDMVSSLSEYYYDYEVEQVVERAEEIRSAIRSREWDKLGLP